jgi:hypothetical protein
MTDKKILHYPVWVSMCGQRSLCWGAPCDAPSTALKIAESHIQSGNASLAFVVRYVDGKKTPMRHFIKPVSARKIIGHWEALWDASAEP